MPVPNLHEDAKSSPLVAEDGARHVQPAHMQTHMLRPVRMVELLAPIFRLPASFDGLWPLQLAD